MKLRANLRMARKHRSNQAPFRSSGCSFNLDIIFV
jgi:hypothetical protein